jgi:hypothetical protein
MRNRTWIFAIAGCAVLILCGLGLVAAGGLGYVWYQQGASVALADPPSVEYILDASPRMTKSFKGGTRLEVARAVLAEVVRPADASVAAGLRAFGSGVVTTACQDTNLLVPVAVANQAEIADGALGLEASTTSDSDLAEAMIAAIHDLAGMTGKQTLVVITGGTDTCDAQATQLIQQAAAQAGITLQQFIIGMDLDPAEEAALKQVVATSGAIYLAAPDDDTLRNILLAIQNHIDHPSSTSLALVTAAATPGAVIDLPTAVAVQPTNAITVPSAATPTTTNALGGYQMQTACDNPYNPIRPGATWTYSTSGTGFGDINWTLTVDSVTGDLKSAKAEVTESFGGATYTYQWLCSPDGMQWEATGGMTPNGTMTATVTDYKGQRLLAPALLVPGATWTESYLQASKTSTGTLNESFSGTYTLDGLQSVTTGLGTFDALTVTSNTTDELTSTGGKTTSQQVNTFYYVSGVGPVRYVVKADVGNTLSDLVSYTVPK